MLQILVATYFWVSASRSRCQPPEAMSREGQCGTQMAGEVGVMTILRVLLLQLHGREAHRWSFCLRAEQTRQLPFPYLECQLHLTTNTLASWIRLDQDRGWDNMLLEVLGCLVDHWWPLLKNRMRYKCIEGTKQGTVWIPCRNWQNPGTFEASCKKMVLANWRLP